MDWMVAPSFPAFAAAFPASTGMLTLSMNRIAPPSDGSATQGTCYPRGIKGTYPLNDSPGSTVSSCQRGDSASRAGIQPPAAGRAERHLFDQLFGPSQERIDFGGVAHGGVARPGHELRVAMAAVHLAAQVGDPNLQAPPT